MKKLSLFLTLVVLICQLASCGKSPSDETESSKPSEQPQSTSESTQTEEDNTQTDILYAVFYADEVKEYPIEYTGAQKTAEELAQSLSELTGLDFTITASQTEDGWIVDWAADSTLVAGLDDREQKEEFFFFDYDSQCWFMMDSLWRTLTENLDAENIYYTMDGGQELVLENLSSSINTFPSDVPYMGSGFYAAHDDVRGDEGSTEDGEASYNTYYDESTGLLLTYPDVFSSEGTLDENGKMNFYTLWDTGMLFWIESNESGWTTDAFLETFDARARMELQGNVIIACGEGTDAYGNVVPMAWYCVVDPGFIANVEVHCTDSDEADYWYEEFQNDAFWIENARGIYGEG